MNDLQDLSKPLISKEEAQSLLQQYMATFWKIMQAVWKAWEGIPEEHRMMMTNTARANCLYSFIIHHARTHFSADPNVKILEKRLFLVGIKGLVLLRFKKLKSVDDKRSSNYPTLFQVNYTAQQMLPDMPPEAARLTVGYVLDVTAASIQGLFVTYPCGKMLHWDFEVERRAPKVVQLPTPQQGERKRRVRAKNVEAQKKTDKQ
jgi:hypothetical protein